MANIEVIPPTLCSNSNPPPRDGATRLYISYTCPFAQRVWIARNYKGLQDKIELVPINLDDKPAWYKDVYPLAKVPVLEHNNETIAESLDLLKYLDTHFEGPSLFPHDAAKKEFAEELLACTSKIGFPVVSYLSGGSETEMKAVFDKLEEALSKFEDGPFFLGQFGAVDIAFAPFIERYHPLLLELKNYDITIDRPKLTVWLEELNKVDGYKQSKYDINEILSHYKRRLFGIV